MLKLVVITALVLGLALVARRAHARSVSLVRDSQRRRAMSSVPQENLALSGDIMGRFELRGNYLGHEVELLSRTEVTWPGSSGETKPCSIVRFKAPIQDMLICLRTHVDRIMGPVPAVPRIRTGDPAFDEVYAIFVSPHAVPRESGFRDRPGAPGLDWARREVLAQCLTRRPAFIRANEGECEIVGSPLEAAEMGAMLALAVNIARAANGKPLVSLPPTPPSNPRILPLTPLWIVAGRSALLGFCIAVMLCPSRWVMAQLFESVPEGELRLWIGVPALTVIAATAVFVPWVLGSAVVWWRRTHETTEHHARGNGT